MNEKKLISKSAEYLRRLCSRLRCHDLLGYLLTLKCRCMEEGNQNGGSMCELYEDKGSRKEIEDPLGFYLTQEF